MLERVGTINSSAIQIGLTKAGVLSTRGELRKLETNVGENDQQEAG
jgi:hypothetical protein